MFTIFILIMDVITKFPNWKELYEESIKKYKKLEEDYSKILVERNSFLLEKEGLEKKVEVLEEETQIIEDESNGFYGMLTYFIKKNKSLKPTKK